MSCSATISITTVSQPPCCSWKVTKTHPCGSPLARLYEGGTEEIKLFAPVRIRRDGSNFTLQDKQSSAYINYEQEAAALTVDEEAVNVALEDFEQYLHTFFCCPSTTNDDEDPACGNYILATDEVNAACSDDTGTFQIIITNQSGGYIPAGTVFNLNWIGIGANPVYSVPFGDATIAVDGSTLQITEDWANTDAIQFQVSFDNVGCASGNYAVVISPSVCFTMSPSPFIISYQYNN